MGEFFRGWRRKIGVVTLLMACLFMGGWVRGSYVSDIIDLGGQGEFYRLNVNCHGLMWFRSQVDPGFYYGEPFTYRQRFVVRPAEWYLRDEAQVKILSYRHWAGFHLSRVVRLSDGVRTSTWVIPYWSITTPLTLASLWFLVFSKPRPSQTQSTSNSIPEAVS